MTTVTQKGPQTKTAPRPATQQVKKEAPKNAPIFLFDSNNYKWMIGGVVLILLGFALMVGGKSPDPHQFDFDKIFSFRRITLAPFIVLLGSFVEVYAIMKKPAEAKA
jgi:hypothetical protein